MMSFIIYWFVIARRVIPMGFFRLLIPLSRPFRSTAMGCGIHDFTDLALGGKLGFNLLGATAIEFVSRVDPKLTRRIAREIHHVFGVRSHVDAEYCRWGRICLINTRRLLECPAEDRLLRMIEILAHEATHGFLHSKRIPYTLKLRRRIERLCESEQDRVRRKFSELLKRNGRKAAGSTLDTDAWWTSCRVDGANKSE